MRSSEILSLDERGSDSKVANRPQQHEDRQARSNEAEIVWREQAPQCGNDGQSCRVGSYGTE